MAVKLAIPTARTVVCVERDAFAASVLVARMEDEALDPAPIWDDLKTFDGRAWRGAVDLVTAGYPCQPFSHAGKRDGEDDERHLWPDVARIVREVEPRLVYLENVRGHLSLGFGRVLGDLAELGFDTEWTCVRASDVGAPHRRERVFVLGVSDTQRDAGAAEPRFVGEERLVDAIGARREAAGPGSVLDSAPQPLAGGDDLADALRPRPEGARQAEPKWLSEFTGGGVSPWPPGPDGDWSRVPADLLPAGDAPQPPLRERPDGVPVLVDGGGLDAHADEGAPAQAVRGLREDDAAEAVRSSGRGRGGLPEEEVLRPEMYGSWADEVRRRLVSVWRAGQGTPAFEECVRTLRDFAATLDPPHRQELEEQLSREPGDALRFLSFHAPPRGRGHRAQEGPEELSRLRRAILAPRFEDGDLLAAMRLDPAEEKERAMRFRADRLRCMGNAVVPQQGARAFLELLGRVR